MRIDLHIHTWPRSPCSVIEPVELIQEARHIGLDGICLTEHNTIWDREQVHELARDGGVLILRGNEITTNQGDVLVFGLEEDIQGVVTVQELRAAVEAADGFMIVAHPFRGFLLVGVTQLRMDAEQASKRPIFQYVDAVEICNCKVTDAENDMARQVAQRLGLSGVAGSDAHRLDEVGRCVTVLEREIGTTRELIEELRAGRFSTGSLR